MKIESFLKVIIEVSEKFDKHRDGSAGKLLYETLHMSLALMMRELTEEQYNSIPLVYTKTYEKLEKSILECVSSEYEVAYVKNVLEQGKFKPASKKEEPKIITKCKNKIGFTAEFEEGTTI